MRIKVVYGDQKYYSKEVKVEPESVEEFAENLQNNINKMTELKLEIEGGWVVLPKYVLERSVIVITK